MHEIRTPVWRNGASVWATSTETLARLDQSDHPKAASAAESLRSVCRRYDRYSGESDDIHAHALSVAWALDNPNTFVGRSVLGSSHA